MVKFHPCSSYGKPVEEKLPFSYMNESVYKRKKIKIRHFRSFYILLKSQQSEFFFLAKTVLSLRRSLNCLALTRHVRVGQLRITF